MQTNDDLAKLINITDNSSTVTLEDNDKGLCLKVDNQRATLLISLFGGHVLSYINKKDNKERLWLSNKAIFDGRSPIRGGIPICWPWFSAHYKTPSYPSHGFARTQVFTLLSIEEITHCNKVDTTHLTLVPSKLDQFAYNNVQMKLVISVSDTLRMSIISINNSEKDIFITQALHTYFKVDDINQTLLKGVTSDYDDKLNQTVGNKALSHYSFESEVDRIHQYEAAKLSQTQTIEIVSTNNKLTKESLSLTKIEQSGHDSTVVWNPWLDKSKSMKDMEEDGFLSMLCIEAANTRNAKKPLKLAPNETHTLTQTIY